MKKSAARHQTIGIFVVVVIIFGMMGISSGEEVVKVGVVYPLTGGLEATGRELKEAIELAVEICNNKHPELSPLLTAETEGVTIKRGGKLVRAKIAIEWGNSEAKVETGAAEVRRLVRDKGAVAILGAYHSAITRACITAAAKEEVPILTQSVAIQLTNPEVMGESLKWFFRPTHTAMDTTEALLKFMDAVQEKTKDKIKNVALYYENTLYGVENGETIRGLIKEKYKHYNLVAEIAYPQRTSDVVAEVLALKKANPDVIWNAGPQPSEAILFTKTFKEQGLWVKGFLWGDAGVLAPAYLENVGKEAEFFISHNVFSPDQRVKKPLVGKVNDMFKKRTGYDMASNSARALLKALVLFDAINRAQSDKPDDIRKALVETDIPEEKTNFIFGVKFDPVTHQNIRCAGLVPVCQVREGKWRLVYPWKDASIDLVWPTPKSK